MSKIGIIPVGILECLLVSWIYGTRRLVNHTKRLSGKKIGLWRDISIKYIAPIVLLFVLGVKIFNEIQNTYGG